VLYLLARSHPLTAITAEIVDQGFLSGRFGIPSTIIIGCGRQFSQDRLKHNNAKLSMSYIPAWQ
jgi:hypothetical protein